ncbi:MAG: ABC transporter substrate-binding protein [Crocosphaera sp.]|nr:ABC transporter substrate-binding protein [Crocosphaera sp.]
MKKSTKTLIKFFSIIGMITTVIILWELFCREITLPIVYANNQITLEDRFSFGERRLFREITIKDGIDAFKEGDYEKAEVFFRQVVGADRSDPEVQIYLNNSKARQREKDPFILATVVPIDNQENNAKTILRGIADAQTEFNEKGLNNRLLEIMIVNDSNNPKISQKVAQKLANNPSVLGVIGHNASSSTKAALPEYTKAQLPVISSTSTATDLSSYVFFRTVPSNERLASCLADYTFNHNLKRLAIFYTEKAGLNTDALSNYSITLKNDFAQNFPESIERNNLIDMSDPNFNPKDTVTFLIDQPVDGLVLFPSSNLEIVDLSLEVAKANKKLPNPFKLLGGDTIYNAEALISGDDAVEGLVLAVPWFAKDDYSYTKRAEKRWGGQVSWRTATSYDATQAFIHALSPNVTREPILNKLRQTNLPKEKTSGQPLRFFGDGERSTPPILVQVVEGNKNAPAGSKYTFTSLDYKCK